MSLSSYAAERKVLSAEAASLIRGKTVSVVSHQPREVAIFGQRFLVAQKDKQVTGSLLGDPTGAIFKDNTAPDGTSPDIEIAIPSIADPAHLMINAIEQRFISTYDLTALDHRLLPPTPRGNVMPNTDVARLVADTADTDLALDIQTFTWQISRISRLTGLWFTYIGRMSLIDRRTKTILAERDCVSLQRYPKSDAPYLLSYIENDMAAFKNDLHKAASQCTEEFLHALRIP